MNLNGCEFHSRDWSEAIFLPNIFYGPVDLVIDLRGKSIEDLSEWDSKQSTNNLNIIL